MLDVDTEPAGVVVPGSASTAEGINTGRLLVYTVPSTESIIILANIRSKLSLAMFMHLFMYNIAI